MNQTKKWKKLIFNTLTEFFFLIAGVQIEESSLITHLMQKKQEEEVRGGAESPLLPLGSLSKCLWT